MLDFNGTNGKNPYGSLTLSGTTLYGMTSLGGANNLGLIFRSSVLTSLNELPNNIGQGQLFPNPSNGKFTFSLPSSPAKQQLNIYNVLGEKVYQSSIDLKATQVIIPNPVSGIYFYRLLSSNGTLLSSGKFIIEL